MKKNLKQDNLLHAQKNATETPPIGGLSVVRKIKAKRLRAGKEGDTLARLTLFFIFIALECVLLITVYIKFLALFKCLIAIFYLLALIFACKVASGHKGMDSKIAWIMFLLIFAPVSVLVYAAAGESGASPIKVKRLKRIYARTNYLKKSPCPSCLPPSLKQVCSYVQNSSSYPAYFDGEVVYFPSGESFFDSLLQEIDSARSFIFIEFFIVSTGSLAQTVWEKLIHKHREGVDIRIICDGLGSANFIHSKDAKMLKKSGIKLAVFEPVLPLVNLFVNYRNHRKLVVIDGHTAYTGGVNLADEYINQKLRFGHFKDAGVRVRGLSANSFTLMFLRMWHFAARREPDYKTILAKAKDAVKKTKTMDGENPSKNNVSNVKDLKSLKQGTPIKKHQGIIPYGDGPCEKSRLAKGLYVKVIENAKKQIYIMTPYFVADSELIQLLMRKALGGVDVRLIIPKIPDKKPVYVLTRYFAESLIPYGVKVYTYCEGFVHSKVLLCDGESAVVGSVNFDYRSFYQQYECGVYFTNKSALKGVMRDFKDTFSVSKLLTQSSNRSIIRRVAVATLKMFAPLM